jgi:sporulation protein YlmC with PRC-barrel domain
MKYQHLIAASALDGDEVINAQGDSLGHVKDIMIDVEAHRIAYYVLSFGGILGMGDKLFAIPPEAMTLVDEKKDFRYNDTKNFILNVAPELLEKAEGFDKDNWPNMADSAFRNKLYEYYGKSGALLSA